MEVRAGWGMGGVLRAHQRALFPRAAWRTGETTSELPSRLPITICSLLSAHCRENTRSGGEVCKNCKLQGFQARQRKTTRYVPTTSFAECGADAVPRSCSGHCFRIHAGVVREHADSKVSARSLHPGGLQLLHAFDSSASRPADLPDGGPRHCDHAANLPKVLQ